MKQRHMFGCLLLNEVTQKAPTGAFSITFIQQISNHLSIAIFMSPDGWSLKTGLTVLITAADSNGYHYEGFSEIT